MSSVSSRRSFGGPRACGVLLAAVTLAACARQPKPEPPQELAVDVYSDTSGSTTWSARPRPAARVWVERVTPARPAGAAEPELPDAPSAAPAADAPASAPEGDAVLHPPILERNAPLVMPGAGRRGRGSVELEVRVDEDGAVSDVRFAGGTGDTAMVGAASRCARAMHFYPALLAGRPVAVWCRQRFDFGGR